MNIRIQKRENPFVQIDKTPIDDGNLSPESLGVLTYLLSKPNNWKAHKNEILKRFKDGDLKTTKNKLDNIFKELCKAGYMKMLPLKETGTGKLIGSEHIIYELPTYEDVPTSEILDSGKSSDSENVPNYSNNDLNNNNKKEKNNDVLKSELKFSVDTFPYITAKKLADYILYNNPKHKPITEKELQDWAKDIDKCCRLDSRSEEDVTAVLDWCQKDDFWYKNILSANKLRIQFDKLYVKMMDEVRKKRNYDTRNGEEKDVEYYVPKDKRITLNPNK